MESPSGQKPNSVAEDLGRGKAGEQTLENSMYQETTQLDFTQLVFEDVGEVIAEKGQDGFGAEQVVEDCYDKIDEVYQRSVSALIHRSKKRRRNSHVPMN